MLDSTRKNANFFTKGAIMQEKYITEEGWVKIYNVLQPYNLYISNEAACKLFILAVLWMLRSGAQWRELPQHYGKWNNVFVRFSRWSKKGIWEKLFKECSWDQDLEYVLIDSTIVRAHPCSAGQGKQEEQALGRSKGGFTTKIHAATDALGNPTRFIATPGNRNDITQAEALLEGITNSYVIADNGYKSKELRDKLIERSCIPVIPPKSNSKSPAEYDKHLYKERHLIECLFSKIKYFRRVFSRFDKTVRNFLSFIYFAGVIVWLR